MSFSMKKSLFDLVSTVLKLYFGWYPLIMAHASNLTIRFLGEDYLLFKTAFFLFSSSLIDIVLDTPWSLYYDFGIEARWGYNKKDLKTFITDLIKGIFLTLLFGPPVITGMVKIIEWAGPETFFYYCTIFAFGFICFMMILYPNFIAPLFNKFTLLNESGEDERQKDLHEKIYKIAEKVNFPLSEIYIIDGSKRSDHSNAYFFGIFKKKMVVLFDTLMDKMDNDNITGIICHEFGHWYHWHNVWNLITSFFNLFFMLYFMKFFLFQRDLYLSFGYSDIDLVGGIFLAGNFMIPFNLVLHVVMNYLTRVKEYQADEFALRFGMGDELIIALVKLFKSSKADVDKDPLYSMINDSHPGLLERIRNLDNLKKQQKKVE